MTTKNPERAAIHAYLSSAGRDHIQGFADLGGISMTAMLEALATMLIDGTFDDAMMAEWVERARRVDAQRRRRRYR